MKILHLILLDKFIAPFIDLLEGQESFKDHFFYIRGDERRFPIRRRENTLFVGDISSKFSGFKNIVKLLNDADKIILHGLFDLRVIVLLFFQPWLLKKSYWVIWGGDLYCCQSEKRNLKWIVKEFFRRPVIKHMGHLVTYVEGDVELARKWYGARGKYNECIMYVSNIYRDYAIKSEAHGTINIQIGNSADPSNNHLEVLELLLPFRDSDIVIYVPLSYGSPEYAQTVIKAGTELFGDKFKPMIDFMPFDQYVDFLGEVDIAIFNHKRQQAMGNAITLLGMGKKVYFRDDATPWKMFERLGAKIYSVAEIDLLPIDVEQRSHNQALIKTQFSEQKLLTQLKMIFKE